VPDAEEPEAVESLDADELERELTIAAAGPGRQRLRRFLRLLLERRRRGGSRP
jgi:hypothetical protein